MLETEEDARRAPGKRDRQTDLCGMVDGNGERKQRARTRKGTDGHGSGEKQGSHTSVQHIVQKGGGTTAALPALSQKLGCQLCKK